MKDLDEYEQWYRNRSSYWENFKKSVSPVIVIGFLVIVLLGAYLISSAKVNPVYIYLIAGVILIVIIFKAGRAKEKLPIPENIIKIIGLSLMKRKIGTPEFPNGTMISPTPYCKMRFEGEWGQAFKPWKWEVGFNILYPNALKETVLVVFHPYDGYITGIVGQPAGWKAEKANDLKIMMPMQMSVQEEKPKK